MILVETSFNLLIEIIVHKFRMALLPIVKRTRIIFIMWAIHAIGTVIYETTFTLSIFKFKSRKLFIINSVLVFVEVGILLDIFLSNSGFYSYLLYLLFTYLLYQLLRKMLTKIISILYLQF